MSHLDTHAGLDPGAPDPRRSDPLLLVDRLGTPPQPGGVLFSGGQRDHRGRTAVKEVDPTPVRPRRLGRAVAYGALTVTSIATAGATAWALWGSPKQGAAQPNRQVAEAPTDPDSCMYFFDLSYYYLEGDPEVLRLHNLLDQQGQDTGETNGLQTTPPAEWVAATFQRVDGVDQYALLVQDLETRQVVVTPLGSSLMVFDENGRTTVYTPVPEQGQRVLVMSYGGGGGGRPLGPIPTAVHRFRVGSTLPPDIQASPAGGRGVVCTASPGEVTYGRNSSTGSGSSNGGSGGNELPPDSPGGSLQNDGEVTSNITTLRFIGTAVGTFARVR